MSSCYMVSSVDQFTIEFLLKDEVNSSSQTIHKIGFILLQIKTCEALKNTKVLFSSAQRNRFKV